MTVKLLKHYPNFVKLENSLKLAMIVFKDLPTNEKTVDIQPNVLDIIEINYLSEIVTNILEDIKLYLT